jgi:hypothetical protein
MGQASDLVKYEAVVALQVANGTGALDREVDVAMFQHGIL